MSFRDTLAKDEKESGIGNSGFFKFLPGKNRLRILTEPRAFTSEYENKETGEKTMNTKFLCYVLTRDDGKMKAALMPYKFVKGLVELEGDELAQWDGSFPMPYDVTIEVENPGKITVKYGAVRATLKTPLTDKEQGELENLKPIQDIRNKLKEKRDRATQPELPDHDDRDDIINFN